MSHSNPLWRTTNKVIHYMAANGHLRARIAKALQGEADDGFTWEDWLPLADAVIRELSEPQRGELVPCPTCDDRQCMDCVLRHQHDRCANTCPRAGDCES